MSATRGQVCTSTLTYLPPIRRSKIHKDFRKPPRIPVTLNKRTLYKPYTMMYDDDLVELKRMERSELNDKTRLRNKMEMDRCWRNINLSYRDHMYAMGSIRQEQSLVYHLMCKVQKDKRKMQRQTHRRHEEDFQKKMRWQRIKSMCHYVVFKFRENVKRKREGRLVLDEVNGSNKPLSTARETIVSKAQIKPHLQGNPLEENRTEQSKYVCTTEASENELSGYIETARDNGSTNKTASPNDTILYARSNSIQEFDAPENEYEKRKSQDECSEKSLLESTNSDCSSIQGNDIMYKQSTEARPRTKVIQVSKNRPSKHLTRDIENINIKIATPCNEDSPNETAILEADHTAESEEYLDKDDINHVSFASRKPGRIRRKGVVYLPDTFLPSDKQPTPSATRDFTTTHHEDMCKDANHKHKQERESLVHIMKKRARMRAKRDLDRLNNETFVKYEKTKNGLLEAYPGKRETFIPPSSKNIYNRHKLLRQEKEAIFLQKIKLEQFFESVVDLLERPVRHQKTDKEVKERKSEIELPALHESNSIQLASSIFNVTQPEQVKLSENESNRYVRVYDRTLKEDVQFNRSGRRMSSWKT